MGRSECVFDLIIDLGVAALKWNFERTPEFPTRQKAKSSKGKSALNERAKCFCSSLCTVREAIYKRRVNKRCKKCSGKAAAASSMQIIILAEPTGAFIESFVFCYFNPRAAAALTSMIYIMHIYLLWCLRLPHPLLFFAVDTSWVFFHVQCVVILYYMPCTSRSDAQLIILCLFQVSVRCELFRLPACR